MTMLYITLLFFRLIHADDFKTHMIDHQNPGCPTNSECSKQMGIFYNKWSNVLKTKSISQIQSFYEKNGLPLEVWVIKKHKNQHRILWDSRCQKHNKESVYIKSALIKGKKFQELKNIKKYATRHALILSKNKVKSYIIPSTDLPLYNSKNGLVFLKSVDGHYFSHSLSVDGKFKFIKAKEPKEYPRTVECPAKLKKEYEKIKHPKNLYSGHFCQKMWNEHSGQHDVIMTGWDCN